MVAVVFSWNNSITIYVDIFIDKKILQYMFTKKELNPRQIRWLELLKDYNMIIHYQPVEGNVVVDSLTMFSMGSIADIKE